jgi:hypothetical protein
VYDRVVNHYADSSKLQAVANYFGNHGRRKKKANNPVRAWSLSQVVGKVHKEEVDNLTVDASGCPKGSTGFFKFYQKVLANFVTKRLTEEEREKYRKMAREWTERSPPEAVQQEYACIPIIIFSLMII